MSSIKRDTQAFLSTLKKDYSKLSYNEKIIANFYYNFVVLGISNNTVLIMRYCGAVEAILTIEGYLKPFEDFEYQIKYKKFLWIRYKEKEGYKEYLLRIANKFLEDRGIL